MQLFKSSFLKLPYLASKFYVTTDLLWNWKVNVTIFSMDLKTCFVCEAKTFPLF